AAARRTGQRPGPGRHPVDPQPAEEPSRAGPDRAHLQPPDQRGRADRRPPRGHRPGPPARADHGGRALRPQQLPRGGVLRAHRGQHRLLRQQPRLPGEHLMTTAALTRSATRAEPGYRFRSATRMEWLKLRSVRSTSWILLVFAVGMIGLSVLVLSHEHWATMSAGERAAFDPVNEGFTGLALGQLVLGVLGVLAITTEFSSGMIRATFAAAPRRPVVLTAKAAVVGAVTLVAGGVLAF